MFIHKCVYRHDNGDVEGFKGTGFSAVAAKADATDQIKRKLSAICLTGLFNQNRVIDSMDGLTSVEIGTVEADWGTNLRY